MPPRPLRHRSTEDKVRIEKEKDGLLNDCYAWILHDPSFRRWRINDESTLLWIRGDPGKGKTMMMIGLVNELSGNGQAGMSSKGDANTQEMVASEPDLVSFFFCQKQTRTQQCSSCSPRFSLPPHSTNRKLVATCT